MSRPNASFSYAARREVIERMALCSQQASFLQKGLLLDTMVATTGSVRACAVWLLHHLIASTPNIPHTMLLPTLLTSVLKEALAKVISTHENRREVGLHAVPI